MTRGDLETVDIKIDIIGGKHGSKRQKKNTILIFLVMPVLYEF